MKKVIVTGGAGFIGSNLVDELIDQGVQVTVIDDLSTGKKENINPKAKHELCGITEVMPETFKGVDTVFHLAAKARVQPSIEDPLGFNTVNVSGTLRLLELSHKAGVKRFIFSSSSSVYGDEAVLPAKEDGTLAPLSPYAAQKLMGEEYCKLYARLHGMETTCLRYFNVFGPRQALDGAYRLVMGIFAQQRLDGKDLSITGTGEQRRDFTFVGDVVRANILAATADKTDRLDFVGTAFNIGRGSNRSVNQIAKLIGGPTVHLPPRVEPFETLADNSKAWCLLKWEPTIDVDDWVPGWLKEIGVS